MVSIKSLALAALAATAYAQCTGPAVNQATLNLIKEFEGWRPNICMHL
jgi:lysozyme